MNKKTHKNQKKQMSMGLQVACIVLALVLIAAAVLTILQFCTPYKPSNGFKPADNQTNFTPPADGNKVLASDDGGMLATQEPQEGGVKFLMTRIASEDFTEYGISEQAESALTITITNIQPETAIHTTTVWAASWKETASGNVTDYVTVTPSSDTLSATLVCKQAFRTQIEVSATFQTGNKVKVTTVLDYIARVDPNSKIALSTTETDKTTISFGERRGQNGMGQAYTPTYTVDVSSVAFGVGTIVPTVEEKRDEMGLQNGTTIAINFKATNANKGYEWLQEYLQPVKITSMFYANANFVKGFLTNTSLDKVTALLEYMENNASDAFVITYTFNAKHDGKVLSTETLTNTFAADVSRLTNVSGAEMDKPSVAI